ncbi:MAG: hypothetical protein F6K16_31235 [Symploca sp. SIO2B6]|nr:hypothetical protein [Symploca sp. SIO2B6]
MTATLTQPVSCDNTKSLKHPFAAFNAGISMTSTGTDKNPPCLSTGTSGGY